MSFQGYKQENLEINQLPTLDSPLFRSGSGCSLIRARGQLYSNKAVKLVKSIIKNITKEEIR